jgi:hypothetical protein
VRSLIKLNARQSFSSCPIDLQKLQNRFLSVLWYFVVMDNQVDDVPISYIFHSIPLLLMDLVLQSPNTAQEQGIHPYGGLQSYTWYTRSIPASPSLLSVLLIEWSRWLTMSGLAPSPPQSLRGDASNFIAISKALGCDATLC